MKINSHRNVMGTSKGSLILEMHLNGKREKDKFRMKTLFIVGVSSDPISNLIRFKKQAMMQKVKLWINSNWGQ